MANTAQIKEYPEVLDERIDDRWWQCLQQSVDLTIKTKAQTDKMHVWVDENILMSEKSSVAANTDIALILSMADPRKEAEADIKGFVPFLVKSVDETITIAEDCPLDLDYPDLQNMVFNLFEITALKPGAVLTVKKTV